MRIHIVVLSLMLQGCPGGDSSEADAGMLVADDAGTMLDTSKAGFASFVKAKSYSGWKAEGAVHNSTGPHGGKVRTYVNETMYTSLKSGTGDFPAGSITVKELYASDATTITGHAVNAKDGATWVFYEGFTSDDYKAPYYFRGTGNLCSNCHASGRDFFLTPPAQIP